MRRARRETRGSAGWSSPADTHPARLQSLLTSFDEKFRQRVKLAFDASEVRPVIAYSVAPGTDAASAPVATIRLTGQIPPDARHFTWTYAWTFASLRPDGPKGCIREPRRPNGWKAGRPAHHSH